jgi:hypothetical protein
MSKFDPELACAELYRFEVLIHHNLRQIDIERDYETAKHFHQQLQNLAQRGLETAGKIRRLKREGK